ncbi:hypothetical protein PLICRDRAFT_52518 [Plicaturopsis crispa FD-325 SS-3]|nr:hypothetical protein PLICRDRAFT_52518 [Plicaturopsis crispa FD-325 SS-3]
MASGVKSMQHDGLRARKPSLAHLPESAHHAAFVQFLTGMAHSGLDPNYRTVARGKLSRLSTNQFSELTDDVHDELERRTMKESDPLSSPPDYHPKRAAARAKLCTLPDHRFGDLVGDVLHDLRSRYPDVVGVLMFHLP